MVDDSALYMALADLALYKVQNMQKSRVKENAQSMRYYSTSLRLINCRIQTLRAPVTTAVIHTILGMAGYDVRSLQAT